LFGLRGATGWPESGERVRGGGAAQGGQRGAASGLKKLTTGNVSRHIHLSLTWKNSSAQPAHPEPGTGGFIYAAPSNRHGAVRGEAVRLLQPSQARV